MLEELAGEIPVVLHCFSSAALLEPALEHGWYVSFAGNVTYPKAGDLRWAAAQVPADRILAETDSPYLAPQSVRGKPNEPANVMDTLAALAEARGEEPAALEARIEENAAPRVRAAVSVRPKKELGQHFLADPNILGRDRPARRASSRDDVVLEIGPGLGVLTEFLAPRVAHVHAVELDESLAPALRDRLSPHDNVELILGDALRLPLHELDPPPSKLVANLPYNVATPLLVESLDGLPGLRHWTRDGAARGRRPALRGSGHEGYGAVSVLVELTAERTGFHPVSRTVFRPPPNVDSALVAFRRTRDWGPEFAA